MAIHFRTTLVNNKTHASARLAAVSTAVVFASATMVTSALAVPKKAAAGHSVKGQSQIAGGFGRFNTVYTLKGQMNYEHVKKGEKFLILHLAVKNARDSRQPFDDGNGFYTLVDSHGQTYTDPPSSELASAGVNDFNTRLNPGQGLGQPALHDPYTEAFELPGTPASSR